MNVRAAAHVHSDWSYDGVWSLDEIARAFTRRRRDAVLMAEHDRGFDERKWAEYQQACAAASNDRILLVPGIEYEDPDNVVHIAVWGNDVPFLGERRPTIEILREAESVGALCIFAHPWRRDAITRHRPEWTPLLSAVEIWNRRYDGIAPNPAGLAFANAQRLSPFTSLDFHSRRHFSPGISIDIDGGVTIPAVLDALRECRYRPEVFGIPALLLTRGLPGMTAQMLERMRRAARGPVRKVQRALSARP